MPLTPGTRLGVYDITAQIGAGGMGAVFRATDTSLSRQVAIKVLPDAFAADPERLARFEREAKTLAALNHPHIAAIYGFEKSSGLHALVMELVEGDDLSQRIARGAIPIDEALPIARQIAEALEAAHEQGIIHRDLKPANIKVRDDGTVKVLDFGLAKAMDPPAGSSPTVSQSPTITTPAMTQAGMILGTAAYMAPEQARGKAVDKRADIWAFGAVLFEMLTGKRAFPGEDLADTLAAVVKLEPKWDAIGSDVPARVCQVLRVCLQKDPKQRAQAIGDVRLALDGAFETVAPQATVVAPSSSGRRLAWVVAAIAVIGMVALAVPTLRHLRETPPPPPPETRTDINTPATDAPASFALSPDGRQIVFVAAGDGVSRLWLRSLGATTAQPLAGTEGATLPFWSPDGRSVGFFAESALKRLDLGGGAPQTLAPVTVGYGGTWNTEGVIVFSPSLTSRLQRVSANGGPVTAVTTLGPQQLGHGLPVFLPDGRRILFTAAGAPDAQGIYLAALDGSAPTRLTSENSQAAYLPTGLGDGTAGGGARSANAWGDGGWLLWARANTLVTQRLDLDRQTLVGDPVTLADGMRTVVGTATAAGWSVAAPGLIAYRPGGARQRQLTWVDPSGMSRGTAGEPDGTQVMSNDGQTSTDLWVLPMVGEHRPSVFLKTPFREAYGAFSPDGRWVAYQSNESGRNEIYVRPFVAPVSSKSPAGTPAAGGQWQVSTAGGIRPMWRPDGKALYYLNAAGAMMAAPVAVVGDALAPDAPVVLFPTHIMDGGVDTQNGRQYDVAPDGRFLINTELPGDAGPVTLIQHWNPEARK